MNTSTTLCLAMVGLFAATVCAAQPSSPIRTGEKAILAALQEPTSIDFAKTPLTDVVNFFRNTHRVEILLDNPALHDVGIRGESLLVTRQVQNISLQAALGIILRDFDLTWTILDEVLLITTPEAAEELLYAQVYDVTDLAYDPRGGAWNADYDSLIAIISASIRPEAWDCAGQDILPLDCGAARLLVIHQTRDIHDEITQLLTDLESLLSKRRDKLDETDNPNGT